MSMVFTFLSFWRITADKNSNSNINEYLLKSSKYLLTFSEIKAIDAYKQNKFYSQ